MANTELIDLFRNVERSNHPVCNGCPMKYTCDKNQITRCLFGTAADALEAADERIAKLEADKKTLINVIKDKSDFHTTKDAMRIAELESQIPKEGEWKKILHYSAFVDTRVYS